MVTYRQLFNYNYNGNNVRGFESPKRSKEYLNRKKSLMNIIENQSNVNNAFTKNITTTFSINPFQEFISDTFNGYSYNEIIKKSALLEQVSQNGNIYFFDTETIGSFLKGEVKDGVTDYLGNINNKALTVTEFSMYKAKLSEGKMVSNSLQPIKEFSSSMSITDAKNYITELYSNKADSTSISALERLAGYSKKNGAKYGESTVNGVTTKMPTGFANGMNGLNDKDVISGAIDLAEGTHFTKGTKEYTDAVDDLFNLFKGISTEENAILSGVNIENFDMNVMKELFKQTLSGKEDEIDTVFNSLGDKTYDLQHMLNATARKEVVEGQILAKTKLDEKKKELLSNLDNSTEKSKPSILKEIELVDEKIKSLNYSVTLDNLALAVEAKGKYVTMLNGETAHIASIDTKSTGEVFEGFLDILLDKSDKVQNKSTVLGASDVLYMNSAFKFDDERLYVNTEFNTSSNYNPYSLERGHGYNVNIRELNEKAGELAGRKVAQFKDVNDESGRLVSVLLNENETLGELIDGSNTSVYKNTNENIAAIKKATKREITNNIGTTKENFRKINSDEGYHSFESFFNDFLGFKDIDENLNGDKIKGLLSDGIVSIKNEDGTNNFIQLEKDILSPKLISKDGDVIVENARKLIAFSDDFEANRNTYEKIQHAIKNTIGIDNKIYRNNNQNSRNATAMFNNILTGIEDEMYNTASEKDILSYLINPLTNNDQTKELYNKELEKLNANIPFRTEGAIKRETKKNSITAAKNVIEKITGREFNKDDDIIKRMSLGHSISDLSPKDLTSIEILNNNGGYSRISAPDMKSVHKSVKSNIYSYGSRDNTSNANRIIRKKELNKMVSDFFDRGLITKTDFDKLGVITGLEAKMDFLSNSIIENRNYVFSKIGDATFDDIKNNRYKISEFVNKLKLNEDDTKRVTSFLDNSLKNVILDKPTKTTILGQTLDDIVGNKGDDFIERIITNSKIDPILNSNDSVFDDMLKNITGWDENHVKEFNEKVIVNKKAKGKNLTKKIFTDSNNVPYYAIVDKKYERMFDDGLLSNKSIEDLKKKAVVVELPKVSVHNNVKVLERGDVFKVVNNSIIPRGENSLASRDTLSEFIDNLSGLSNEEWGYVGRLNDGKYESANSMANRAWGKIHESKTITGVGYAGEEVDGTIRFFKKVMPNRMDSTLNRTVTVDGLLLHLDSVIANDNELAQSFRNFTGKEPSVLLGEIKTKINNGTIKPHEVTFDGKNLLNFGVNEKIWVEDNIAEIAKSISNNKTIKLDDGSREILKRISEVGTKGFVNSEGKEAEIGLFNLDTINSISPAEEFENTSRPLSVQTSKAKSIDINTVNSMAKVNLHESVKDMINNGSSVEDILGIKLGTSINKENLKEHLEGALEKGYVEGFRSNVRFASPQQIKKELGSFATDIDKVTEIAKNISKRYKINSITADDIIKNVGFILNKSALTEDSGVISKALSDVLNISGIKSFKVDDPSSFKIGSYLEEGTVLGVKDGVKNVYSGQKMKINNIVNGEIITEMYESPGYIKLGSNSEKFEANVPYARDSTDTLIQHTIMTDVLGAPIITNPDIAKHKGYGTILSQYTNAIEDSIRTDKEMDIVNKHLATFGGQDFYVEKGSDGKYKMFNTTMTAGTDVETYIKEAVNNGTSIEEAAKGADTPKRLLGIIEEMKNDNSEDFSGFNDRFNKAINKIEKDKIALLDMYIMQDNTLQNSTINNNGTKGVKLSSRDLTVFGNSIGIDSTEDVANHYIKNSKGSYELIFKTIKDNIEQEIMQSESGRKATKQFHNLTSAIGLNLGYENNISDTLVKEIDLEDILIKGGHFTAEDIPELFNFSMEKGAPNVFKINLGMEITTARNVVDSANKVIGTKEVAINSIYIPSLAPNTAGKDYYLADTNKKVADLLGDLKRYREGTLNRTLGSHDRVGVSKHFENLYNDMMYSMTDDIIFKQGPIKRNITKTFKNSMRLKNSLITPPIYDRNGFVDFGFFKGKDKYIDENGKVLKQKFALVNTDDLLGIRHATNTERKTAFSKLGNQLLSADVARETGFLKILNDVSGGNASIKELGVLKKNVQEMISTGKLDEDVLETIGERFLKEIGIDAIAFRNPNIYNESFSGLKLIANDEVAQGSVATILSFIKAAHGDADGDEVAFILRSLTENSEFTLKDWDDQERVLMRIKRKVESNGLIKEALKDSGKSEMEIANTLKNFVENIDYAESHSSYTAVKELAAKNMKQSVGGVSNAAHEMKVAFNAYSTVVEDPAIRGRVGRSIDKLMTIIEQDPISLKLAKLNEVADILQNGEKLKVHLKNLYLPIGGSEHGSRKNREKVKDSLVVLRNTFQKNIGKDYGGVVIENDELVAKAIEDILNGKPAGSTVEQLNNGLPTSIDEMLKDVLDVAQSDEGAKAANSIFTLKSFGNMSVEERYEKILGDTSDEMLEILKGEPVYGRIKELEVKEVRRKGQKTFSNATTGSYLKNLKGDMVEIIGFSGDTEKNVINTLVKDLISGEESVIKGTSNFSISDSLKGYEVINGKKKKKIDRTINATRNKKAVNIISNTNTPDGVKNLKDTLLRGKYNVTNKVDDAIFGMLPKDKVDDMIKIVNVGEYLNMNSSLDNNEVSSLINGMIKRISNKDYQNYKTSLRDEILNSRLAKVHSLNNSNIDDYITNLNKKMSNISSQKRVNNIANSMKNNIRIDEGGLLHNITNSDTDFLTKITLAKNIEKINNKRGKNITNLIKTNINDANFRVNELHWDTSGVKKAIEKSDFESASKLIEGAIVPFDDFAGYQYREVGFANGFLEAFEKNRGNEAYKEFYDIVDNIEILEKNKKGIIWGHGNWSSSIDNFDNLSKKERNEISNIITNINDTIKEKGEAGKHARNATKDEIDDVVKEASKKVKENLKNSDKNAKSVGKSIIEKGGDSAKKSSKGMMMAIAGITAASLVGLAFASGGSINESEKDKNVSIGNTPPNGDVKTGQVSNVNSSDYSNVPMSDTRFYKDEEVGLNVNVSGSGNAKSSNLQSLLGNIGNGNVNINTNYKDSRKQINEREVDEIILNTIMN